MHDAAFLRNSHLGVADKNQRNVVRRISGAPALVIREELAGALAYADAPDVEQVGAGDAMPGAEARGVPLPGDIDPDADDLVRDTLVAEAAQDVVGVLARNRQHL